MSQTKYCMFSTYSEYDEVHGPLPLFFKVEFVGPPVKKTPPFHW